MLHRRSLLLATAGLAVAPRRGRALSGSLSDTVQLTDYPDHATEFGAALTAALRDAQARGRAEIRLPPGVLRLGASPVTVSNPGAGIRVVGAGSEVTVVVSSKPVGDWFEIGARRFDASWDRARLRAEIQESRTRGLTFEEFGCTVGVPMTSGAVFNLRNCGDIAFRNIRFRGVRQAFSLGVGSDRATTPEGNDCVYVDIQDCRGSGQSSPDIPFIRLGSGGILNVKGGGRWNGADQPFIIQDDPVFNWDGLYVYDQFFEQFGPYLTARGGGVGNMIWTGGQIDRARDWFFVADAVQGGHNQDWDIHGVQVLGSPKGTDGVILWNHQRSAVGQGLTLRNNRFKGVGGVPVKVADGTAKISGNTFVTCGGGARAALVQFGGRGLVSDNFAFNDTFDIRGVENYRDGVEWLGPPRRDRIAVNNLWLDKTGQDEVGAR